MSFGEEIRKIREEKGLSQQELAELLGYKTNSYISEIERGRFLPSQRKLPELAKALKVPLKKLKDLLFQAKLEELGIKEPGFLNMLKDYPYLSKKDKRAIIKAYLKIKERKWKR